MSSQILLNGTFGMPSSRQMLAAAGKTFLVTNATSGTAIAYANKTSFSATANGLFSISNGNVTGGPSIYLDRLKLVQTATAPTGTLQMQGEIYQETGIVALTGTAAAITPVNLNFAGGSPSSNATVTFFSAGAGTVAAAVGTRKKTGQFSLATGVTVAGDSFTFEFGADGPLAPKTGLTAARATDPTDLVAWVSPVVIAPQSSAWMNLWWVTSGVNVPSFEFALTYNEL